jgi:hypothetical protein
MKFEVLSLYLQHDVTCCDAAPDNDDDDNNNNINTNNSNKFNCRWAVARWQWL